MSNIDLTGLTPDELLDLSKRAGAAYYNALAAAEAERQTTKTEITATIAALDALIGEGSGPGITNLVGVNQYTGAQMASATSTALPLAFQALLALARDVRRLATVVGD